MGIAILLSCFSSFIASNILLMSVFAYTNRYSCLFTGMFGASHLITKYLDLFSDVEFSSITYIWMTILNVVTIFLSFFMIVAAILNNDKKYADQIVGGFIIGILGETIGKWFMGYVKYLFVIPMITTSLLYYFYI